MKRVVVWLAFIICCIQLFAQSGRTEYVPIDLKWSNPGMNNIKASQPFKVAPYVPSSSGQTWNYTKVTYFDSENRLPTEQKDCVLTIKDDVIHLFFGEHHLQNRIVSRYVRDDHVTVMKTLDADDTVITYRMGNAGIYVEIDIPDYTIRLDK